MKAAVVEGFNDIRYEDVAEPIVGAGEVKVAVRYCGICGSDIPRVLKGACHSFPQILGHEFSGVIAEIGKGVEGIKVGDHVVGVPLVPCMECDDCKRGNFSLCKHYSFIGSRQPGAMAEYVVVPTSNVCIINDGIPFEHAVFTEPATVALHGIKLTGFNKNCDANVAIIGAGTIGLLALQLYKILGARSITLIGRSKDKFAMATELGADCVYSSNDADCVKNVLATGGKDGFQYVYDAVGTMETIKLAMNIAANKAEVCIVGTPTKEINFSVKDWEVLNRKELKLIGSWMSYSAPWPGTEWSECTTMMSRGELRISQGMIGGIYSLGEIDKAFDEYRNKISTSKGRILINIGNGC